LGGVPQGIIEVEEDTRETGEMPGGSWYPFIAYLAERSEGPQQLHGARTPICFARKIPLAKMAYERLGEMEKLPDVKFGLSDGVLGIIQQERICSEFIKWIPGSTPKEHREMMDRERMLQREDRRDREQREWQERQERKRFNWNIIIFGLIVTAILVFAQITSAFIERGGKPIIVYPPQIVQPSIPGTGEPQP
jgi:hypothetical protein